MEAERGIDPQWGRLGRGVSTWLLGRGLLSLHVGAFLLAATGLLLLNLIRAPNDLWVEAPLRRWGVVLLLHAALVGSGWTLWHVSRWSHRRSTAGTSAVNADGTALAGAVGRFSR